MCASLAPVKRLGPLAASIVAGLVSASGGAICSPMSRWHDEICHAGFVSSAMLPHLHPGVHLGPGIEVADSWALEPAKVPSRELLHDSGPRRRAGDPEPMPVQPVEMTAASADSLPVMTPLATRQARRGMSPLTWVLAIVTIAGLVFVSYAPG